MPHGVHEVRVPGVVKEVLGRDHQKACDCGYAEGCSNLGTMYEKGEGVPQDHTRAASLYEQACGAGSALGCRNLGFLYETGEGVPQDFIRAANRYEQACDGGAAMGCYDLGLMYQSGKGVTFDPGRAVALFQKAEEGGFDVPGFVSVNFSRSDLTAVWVLIGVFGLVLALGVWRHLADRRKQRQ